MIVCDIVSEVKVRCVVERYCERKIAEQQMQVAGFLRKLVFIRDSRLVFSNNVSFTREEIETFIGELCNN